MIIQFFRACSLRMIFARVLLLILMLLSDEFESVLFLRATAVQLRAHITMAILSVCPSRVSRPGTESSPGETETLGFHHMVA